MEWPGTRRKSRSRTSTAGCKRHGKAAPPTPLFHLDLDLICSLQRFPFGTFRHECKHAPTSSNFGVNAVIIVREILIGAECERTEAENQGNVCRM